MCRLSGGAASCRQSAAEAGGSVTPRHVRPDATCRAKDAPTAGVDALPTSLFFFAHRGRGAPGVKFERFRHTHPGAAYERAARAYDGGRKGRGFASEFEHAEVERNSADEVQRRLQRRFCLEKVRGTQSSWLPPAVLPPLPSPHPRIPPCFGAPAGSRVSPLLLRHSLPAEFPADIASSRSCREPRQHGFVIIIKKNGKRAKRQKDAFN